ncbi:TPA: integrating conjugative element protein, partial [Escherichia coli]
MKMKTGMVALSVMLYCSIPAMADLLSLPKLNDSTFGYGKSVDGAVSDKLFYTLGGGSVISQLATRSNMQKL